MVYIDLLYKKDLHRPVVEDVISTPIVYGEVQAHRFWVQATETLAGSVTGRFVRPDGSGVLLASSGGYAGVTDGKAWVVLSSECYAYSGYARLYVNITNGAQVTTVLNVRLTVGEAIDGITVDPGNAMNLDASKLEIVVAQADKVQRFAEIVDRLSDRNPTTQDYMALAAKLTVYSSSTIGDNLNLVTADIGVVNGWSSSLTNAPTDITYHNMCLFTQAWSYASARGSLDGARIQTITSQNGQTASRKFENGAWSSWTNKTVLKHKTVSQTTTGNGNVSFGLDTRTTAVVSAHISAINSDATKTAYCITGRWSGNDKNWGAKVVDELSANGMVVLKNTPVKIEVYYYEL